MFQYEERIEPDRYYGEHYATFANYLGRYEFAARFLKAEATVLDLGCGCGYGSAHLAEAPFRTVVGVDRSEEATAYARKRYDLARLSFVTASATELPVKPDSVDAVVAMEMIEHVADAEAVLREVNRVLKRGGVFVVSTPNRLLTGSGETPANPFHVREYTPEEFRTLLRPAFQEFALYGQAFTPAFQVFQDNMARIWHNLSLIPLLYNQLHAVQARLEMDERFTGLSLLRTLKRALKRALTWRKKTGQDSSCEPMSDLNREFRHACAALNSMSDWDISPYQIEGAPVILAVCRK